MKKVLIISASPRKDGNSDLLCKAFEKGALEKIIKQNMFVFLKKIFNIVKDVMLVVNQDTALKKMI